MSSSPIGYLDALFAGIRDFRREIGEANTFQRRARQTEPPAWRSALLTAAQQHIGEAERHLAETHQRLAELGPPERLLPPLDKLSESVISMQRDLDLTKSELAALVSELLAQPLGSA